MAKADTAADGGGVRVRVRGTARITAHASRDRGELVLSGTLADDAGKPLEGESVSVRVTRASDPHDPAAAAGLRAARACASADPSDGGAGAGAPTGNPAGNPAGHPANPARALAYGVRVKGPPSAPEVVVITDDGGRFCFRAKLTPDRHTAHLTWEGTRLVDPASADLAFDLSRRALVLRFDPPPHVLSLDAPRTTVDVTAHVDDDGITHVAPHLALTLADERGEQLGSSTTDDAGRARFEIDPKQLAAPGRGELRVSFAGDGDTAFAAEVARVERHAKVSLHVPAAERGELRPEVAEDGIALLAAVSTVQGPVSEGGVEARIGDELVGAAPVERGLAHLTLTFVAHGDEALVRLRYVPSSPWFEPAGEASVRLPIESPGLASNAPILLAGLAVLVFFLVGRASSRAAQPQPAPPKDADEPEARPGLEVVRAAARGETFYRGRLTDAHERSPVGGGRVWIERGTFEGRAVLASVATDRDGRFELVASFERVGDERIGAEARLHARLLMPLPEPGELSIALVSRRRALLQRLVAWAKRRGTPFDARPEATPGHVRRAALDDPETARWAEAVERAAFGASEVDAEAEREVSELAARAATRDAGASGQAQGPHARAGGGRAAHDRAAHEPEVPPQAGRQPEGPLDDERR